MPLGFVPLYSFLRISGVFIKASFFPLSSALQYSPGRILNKVHSISDKCKPPIKKVALLYFSDCSQFSLHYCPVFYPSFVNSWKERYQITEARLSSALSHLEIFPLPYCAAAEDLHTYLMIFLAHFAGPEARLASRNCQAPFQAFCLKKRFARKQRFALPRNPLIRRQIAYV